MNLLSGHSSKDMLTKEAPVSRLENETALKEIYEFGKKLGQGSYGIVYEATHIETQTKWAIKEVSRPAAGSSQVEMLWREINILQQVNHPHIIHVHEIYRTDMAFYLVTELCEGGELKHVLQRKKFFTEDETRNIIRSLADAVVYLHKRDIVHRDLKLGNILVKNPVDEDDGQIDIRVTDFGLSIKTDGVGIENALTESCGTFIYMAPEVMTGSGYSQWCDMWSIGVIMYMLLCGKAPFVSKTKEGLLAKIKSDNLQFMHPTWDTVSDGAKHILTCLLNVDPAYRISASQLLESPWITGDTNVPAVPSNVLEMMRHHQKQEHIGTDFIEGLPRTFSEDILGPVPDPQAASTEPDSNCRSHAETKERSCNRPQNKSLNISDTSGNLSTTKPHTSVKSSTHHSAKSRKHQDKKDSMGHKSGSDLSKTDDQRQSTSSKLGLASSHSKAGSSKSSSHSKQN